MQCFSPVIFYWGMWYCYIAMLFTWFWLQKKTLPPPPPHDPQASFASIDVTIQETWSALNSHLLDGMTLYHLDISNLKCIRIWKYAVLQRYDNKTQSIVYVLSFLPFMIQKTNLLKRVYIFISECLLIVFSSLN